MTKYRKGAVIVDALQATGTNDRELSEFTRGYALSIQHGSYIVKENGKFSICSAEDFEKNYKVVQG